MIFCSFSVFITAIYCFYYFCFLFCFYYSSLNPLLVFCIPNLFSTILMFLMLVQLLVIHCYLQGLPQCVTCLFRFSCIMSKTVCNIWTRCSLVQSNHQWHVTPNCSQHIFIYASATSAWGKKWSRCDIRDVTELCHARENLIYILFDATRNFITCHISVYIPSGSQWHLPRSNIFLVTFFWPHFNLYIVQLYQYLALDCNFHEGLLLHIRFLL